MDIIYSNFPYSVIIAIIVCSIARIYDWISSHAKNKKEACHQREVYHQKLEYDSLVIECKKLKEELQSVKTIEDLLKEINQLEEQLKGGNNELGDLPFEVELEYLSSERTKLQDRAKELQTINREICQEKERLLNEQNGTNELTDNNDFELSLQDLTNNINNLEVDNQKLETQLARHKPVLAPNCHIDLDVSNFIERHGTELTLDSLEKAYDTLLELKASNPSKSFDGYINGTKSKQDHMKELAELRLDNKQAEIKLKVIKQRYENEMSTFNESRIDHLFKICGARQYSEILKEKSKVQAEMKTNLERELETKSSERSILQDKFHDAEKQCNVYWQAWKDTEVRREQIEAEKRRLLTQSMNLSSRSSLSGSQIPPPPPIMVPTVDEVLRITASQSIGSHYGNFSMNHPQSIPSPPPIEIPLNGTNGNRGSNSAGGGENRTRVGSRYGKVFNSRS